MFSRIEGHPRPTWSGHSSYAICEIVTSYEMTPYSISLTGEEPEVRRRNDSRDRGRQPLVTAGDVEIEARRSISVSAIVGLEFEIAVN